MFKYLIIFLTLSTFAQATHPNQIFARQGTCSAGKAVCGGGCIPQGANCCGSYYCDAPRTCNGKGDCTCLPDTEAPCGDSCMPAAASCCSDGRYCDAGDFCAPVVGFCCHNGEDPATCATRQGFTIPPAGPTTTITSTSATSTTAKSTSNTTTTTASAQATDAKPSLSANPNKATTTTASVGFSTGTATASFIAFTGAAVKRESAVGAILMGAVGLLAAL